MLRDSGHPGLLLVLDEVETLQRVRSDARDKALNALRQLIDEVDAGRFPGLYLVITGTPAFFDGPQGVQRLPPLAQRLATDFTTDPRFDNPRAVQIRLPGFTSTRSSSSAARSATCTPGGYGSPERIAATVDDAYIGELAQAVTGELGGQVGVAPRLFLKKLVADVLDRVEQFDDFDPRRHYALTVRADELTDVERNAAAPADDIDAADVRPRDPRRPGPRAASTTSSTRSGWRDLRPLQHEAIEPLLAGDDALLLAPTAGGKTEAAIFPLLSRMAAERWPGTSVLYLCPLKALLNNLLPRLETYAAGSAGSAALWHGDVAPPTASDPARPAGHPADHAGVAGGDAGQRQRRPRGSSSPDLRPSSSTRSTPSPATTAAGICWPCSSG